MVGNYSDGLVMVNRHRGISPRRVPSRVVAELGRGTGILILYSALFCGIALADTPTRQELPMRAIVRGHNVQPRGDQLKALGYSDLTPQQASEVDRLYRELLKNSDAADRTSLLRRHLGLDSGSRPSDGYLSRPQVRWLLSDGRMSDRCAVQECLG